MSAEVAVGVVDEAIYSLRADGTPDPHDLFYGRRPNWVTTVVSFPRSTTRAPTRATGRRAPRLPRDVALWKTDRAHGRDRARDGHAALA